MSLFFFQYLAKCTIVWKPRPSSVVTSHVVKVAELSQEGDVDGVQQMSSHGLDASSQILTVWF